MTTVIKAIIRAEELFVGDGAPYAEIPAALVAEFGISRQMAEAATEYVARAHTDPAWTTE